MPCHEVLLPLACCRTMIPDPTKWSQCTFAIPRKRCEIANGQPSLCVYVSHEDAPRAPAGAIHPSLGSEDSPPTCPRRQSTLRICQGHDEGGCKRHTIDALLS